MVLRISAPGKRDDNGLHQLFEMLLALGGLGHHDDLVKIRQRRHSLGRRHHEAPPPGVAHEPAHLRVIGVPHNDGGETLVGPPPDNGLDPGHPDAGGVDDAGAGSLKVPALLGGDAVSPDNHQARLRDLPFLQDPDAPLFQEVHHLGVVNQGAIGVDFGVVFMDGPQHHFHGVFDTHAKSRGFGENDFHEAAVFCFRFPVFGYMISNWKTQPLGSIRGYSVSLNH